MLEMLDVQSQHFTGTFKLLHVHQNSGQYRELKILWLLQCMQTAQNSDSGSLTLSYNIHLFLRYTRTARSFGLLLLLLF